MRFFFNVFFLLQEVENDEILENNLMEKCFCVFFFRIYDLI